MSINTFFAMLMGIGLFAGAIAVSTDNYWAFVSGSSLVIVLGGTLAATFLSYEFRYVIGALKAILGTFSVHRLDRASLNAEVGRVIRWAYMVQKDGIITLEAEAKNTPGWDGGFLLFGVELILSGYNGEETRRILSNTIESAYERSLVRAGILRNMAATAPAFGMIGTLVGLIVMLDTMSDDPSKIGAGMAVALLTTLYGVLLARLMFGPAANKVQQREDISRFRNYLIVDGLAMLADKASPRHIQDRMNSYLDPTIRFDIDTQLKASPQPPAAGATA
ncbi:MAG: motility protein A [Alphaproteobacteria bacterium]